MENQEDFSRHLEELRWRLKHTALVFVILSVFGFYFSNNVINFLQSDLQISLHALTAYEVLYTQISISLLAGLVFSLPVLAYHSMKFAKPGLKSKEYLVLRNYLPFSILLFVIGAVFSYEVIVKYSLQFFQSATSRADVAAIWGLQSTLSFSLRLSVFTGLIFQLPIMSLVLSKAGLLDSSLMKEYRAHFIIVILLISAVATPPDLLTQVMVTAPVLGLYQLSVWLVSLSE
jgi:sec-independent protein translocase protein TatC